MDKVTTHDSTERLQTKFTVAICGGGISGLVLAIGLQRASGNIKVDIFESAKAFTEVGASVGVLKRPWKILKNLGLAGDIANIANVPEDEDTLKVAFEMRKADQPQGTPFYDVVVPMGTVAFHRAGFQQILASKLDSNIVTSHFSKRLSSYTKDMSTDTITLHFADGTTATCDVLVGADGIHSSTRRNLLAYEARAIEESEPERAKALLGMIDPIWTGTIAYKEVIPREKLKRINPEHSVLKVSQNYVGRDGHVIAIPITHGPMELLNVAIFRSWPEKEGTSASDIVHGCDKEEVRAHFIGWEDEVQQIIECLQSPTKWAINALNGLPICARERVALIGDAAHAMAPHQGSGAGQAMEDAYILANLLAHPKTSISTLPDVLKVYEAIRLPHANDIQRRSRLNGRLFEFAEGRSETVTIDLEKLKQVGNALMENWKWAWTTDIDDDLAKAVKMLEEQIA